MEGTAGTGTAVCSKVNRANSQRGRGDTTKAIGELTLFLEAVDAPQMPHLLGTQGSKSPVQAVGGWESAEPIVPLLLQRVGALGWTGTALHPFRPGWPHMATVLCGGNLPALIEHGAGGLSMWVCGSRGSSGDGSREGETGGFGFPGLPTPRITSQLQVPPQICANVCSCIRVCVCLHTCE